MTTIPTIITGKPGRRAGYLLGLALVLGACQSGPVDDTTPLPVKVPDPVVDLQAYRLPASMGELTLVGDARRELGPGRLFFYQAPGGTQRARVTLYPLAGGWDTLTPERVVAGQYGIVRQQQLARLGRQGYGAITGAGEGLYQTAHSDYPLAAVVLRAADDPQKNAHIVMLGVAFPVFIRIEREVPPGQAPALADETRQWLEALIQRLSTSNQASSKGKLAKASKVETITVAAICSGACP